MNDASIRQSDSATLSVRRRFGSWEFVVLSVASVCLLYAGHIILTQAFGEASRYSNRSLARPAMGLALVSVTYVLTRLRSQSLWLRIVVWPLAVFICYLCFGAALLIIRMLVGALT